MSNDTEQEIINFVMGKVGQEVIFPHAYGSSEDWTYTVQYLPLELKWQVKVINTVLNGEFVKLVDDVHSILDAENISHLEAWVVLVSAAVKTAESKNEGVRG